MRGCLVLAPLLLASAAEARLCLPPIFEGGQRLHQRFHKMTAWLEPALRQHEVCWRPAGRADEKRVFLLGNSGIYGFPLPIEQTLVQDLNEHFEWTEPPAHFFNLAYVNSYHVKDAVILDEALAYEPDVVVFALTLDDFRVLVDTEWTWSLVEFLEVNGAAVKRFIHERPPGLEAELTQRASDTVDLDHPTPLVYLRQLGRFFKVAVRRHADRVRQWFDPAWDPDAGEFSPAPSLLKTRTDYDCARVEEIFRTMFTDWKERNVLAYLESVEKQTGAEVIVLNWPTVRQPIGRCYNGRYTQQAYRDFNRWIGQETEARSLDYVDMHALLAPGEFFDSLHPTAEGQSKIARALVPVVRKVLEAKATGGTSP